MSQRIFICIIKNKSVSLRFAHQPRILRGNHMAKNLVIVESPAKAKTIGQYLGRDYTVKSSFGHIRDLPKKGLNIDIEHDFEPKYEVSQDKRKVVSDLKKLAK